VKFELGVEIVDRFHGAGAGTRARDAFVARFQQGNVPEQIERITLTTDGAPQRLANVLKNAGLVASTSDGNRMIDLDTRANAKLWRRGPSIISMRPA